MSEASGLSPVLLRISAVRSRMFLRGGETKGGGRFSLGDTPPVHGRSSTTTGTRPPGKGMRKSSWSCIRKSVSLSVQEKGRPMDDDDDMRHGEPWRDVMSTHTQPTIRVRLMQLWAAPVVICGAAHRGAPKGTSSASQRTRRCAWCATLSCHLVCRQVARFDNQARRVCARGQTRRASLPKRAAHPGRAALPEQAAQLFLVRRGRAHERRPAARSFQAIHAAQERRTDSAASADDGAG